MKSFLDKTESLTPEAYEVICDAATEHPFSGNYQKPVEIGTYLCRRCGVALFRANNQFSSGCGWPSFDESLTHHVEERRDADGQRTEIRCNQCKAHLGHVFTGEQFTTKNTRYCVNSLSLDFTSDPTVNTTEEIILAGGCFWGVQHYLNQAKGVVLTEVGYIGGVVDHPSYTDVCNGKTGHYEAVRVIFNTEQTHLSALIQNFFEIHDPTQAHGQGPDLGHQYQSAIFCYTEDQVIIVRHSIQQLINNGYDVATMILPMKTFWPAEEDHQFYYHKHQKNPYCHFPVKRFDISNKPEHS